MYVLDTNVLIYQAAADTAVTAFLGAHRHELFYVPSIVVAEFLSYPPIAEAEAAAFKAVVSQAIILNLDFTLAERAAALRRIYRIKLPDAIVAASAMLTHSELVTRNTRDFKKVAGLKLIYV